MFPTACGHTIEITDTFVSNFIHLKTSFVVGAAYLHSFYSRDVGALCDKEFLGHKAVIAAADTIYCTNEGLACDRNFLPGHTASCGFFGVHCFVNIR